jgi:Telomere resolvase
VTTERQTETLLHFCNSAAAKDLEAALVHARTGWLKDWLTEHLPEIIDGGNSLKDSDRYIEWDLKAKEMMAGRGLEKPEQQKNRLTDIRNAIKSIDPGHPALKYIGFTKEEWEKINRAGDDAVSKRPTLFIENPIAIVEKAEELLNSRDWYDLAAGLAVLTGRRCAEVMKTARFEYKTPYSVIFTGSLKRRDEKVPPVFEIPTLCKAERVIETIAKLRAWMPTEGMTKVEVNNRYAGAIIKSCDRHFTSLVPPRDDKDGKDNLYTHLFRAVYATIAAHWFCPPRVPEGEFKAYIQGHFQITYEKDPTLRNNISSGRHYSDYAIGDGNGNRDGRLGIRLGEPDVVVVEAFQRFYRPDIPEKTGDLDNVEGTESGEFMESSEKRTVTSSDADVTDRSGKSTQKRFPRSKKTEPSGETESETSRQLPLPLPEETSASVPDIQEIVGWMLNSRQYTVLLVGLMTVTGRSPGELIKSGVFKPDRDRSTLTFSNSLSKTRDRLPTLLPPGVVSTALSRLRNHKSVQPLRYLSPNEIDRHCLPHVLRTLHSYLPFKDVGELLEYYRSEVAGLSSGTSATETSPVDDGEASATESEEPKVPDEEVRIEAAETEPDAVKTTDSEALQWAGVARSLAKGAPPATARSLGIDDPDSFRTWIEQQLHPDTDTSPATDDGEGVSEPNTLPTVEPDPSPDRTDSTIAPEKTSPTIDTPEPVAGATKPETGEPMTLEQMFVAQQRSLDQLTGAIFQLVHSLASSQTERERERSIPRERIPSDNSRTTDTTLPLPPSGNANRKRRSPGRPPNEALVHRAIDSIIRYNDSIAITKKDRWLISLSVLKQLTRCNQEVIARVMEGRKEAIDRHHAKHELGTFHNSKGKFAPKITEVIKVE